MRCRESLLIFAVLFAAGCSNQSGTDAGPHFRLTVGKNGPGSGRIASSPSGIDCGAACSADFAAGTSVSLTATSDTGSVFGGWSGDCAGDAGTCVVQLDGGRSVTARFNLVPETLTVAVGGNDYGWVISSPAGINCDAGSCSQDFDYGTTITLTPTAPNFNETFDWTGDCAGAGATCTIAMTGPKSAGIVFHEATDPLTVFLAGNGLGTVTSTPTGIDCNYPPSCPTCFCDASFVYGTEVTLRATPTDPNTVFGGWSGGCSGSVATCVVTVDQAKQVFANFVGPQPLSVNVQGTAQGTVVSSPSGIACSGAKNCSTTFVAGTVVTLTATPAGTGVFTGWSGGCSGSSTVCTVTVDQAQTVTATFDAPPGCEPMGITSRPVTDVSTDPDAGTQMTLAQLRYGRLPDGGFLPFLAHAVIQNATVTAIDFVSADGGTEAFWVSDDSDAGIYVYKRSSDSVASNPVVGDVINIDAAFSIQPKYFTPDGYRYMVGNLFYGSANPKNRPMIITPVASGVTPNLPNIEARCLGTQPNALQDSMAHLGTRIHIPGPITITNARPTALAQVTELSDGGALITGYNGFEIEGSILVHDEHTWSSDGGFGAPDHCDWRRLADAGNTVTFPNGISGVWDTYTMHPCIDNGIGGCASSGDNGYVPSDTSLTSGAGSAKYTYALFPTSCADLPGDAGAGVTP